MISSGSTDSSNFKNIPSTPSGPQTPKGKSTLAPPKRPRLKGYGAALGTTPIAKRQAEAVSSDNKRLRTTKTAPEGKQLLKRRSQEDKSLLAPPNRPSRRAPTEQTTIVPLKEQQELQNLLEAFNKERKKLNNRLIQIFTSKETQDKKQQSALSALRDAAKATDSWSAKLTALSGRAALFAIDSIASSVVTAVDTAMWTLELGARAVLLLAQSPLYLISGDKDGFLNHIQGINEHMNQAVEGLRKVTENLPNNFPKEAILAQLPEAKSRSQIWKDRKKLEASIDMNIYKLNRFAQDFQEKHPSLHTPKSLDLGFKILGAGVNLTQNLVFLANRSTTALAQGVAIPLLSNSVKLITHLTADLARKGASIPFELLVSAAEGEKPGATKKSFERAFDTARLFVPQGWPRFLSNINKWVPESMVPKNRAKSTESGTSVDLSRMIQNIVDARPSFE